MKQLLWIVLIPLIIFSYFTSRPVYKNGDKIRITTTVYTDPLTYSGNGSTKTTVYLKIAGLKVYLPSSTEINYGDKIVIEGVVKDDRLLSPKLISVKKTTNIAVNFRNKLIDFYLNNLPQPESGLLAGIVLGSKGSLLLDFYEKTKATGTAHVVVASGTNVTFVVIFLINTLTLLLPRKKAIPFVIFGIILYLFVSGFEAPLVRAAIMSLFLFMSQETGRLVSTWRVFFMTIFAMLAIKPEWIGDIGFILSFVSTASLMLFEKGVRKWLKHIPELFKEGLSTSLAAQIGVGPILFVTFGQFNILSPIINALVLWTIPPLMILGTAGGILGLLVPVLGKMILYLSYPMLWWFVTVVSIFT